MAIMQKKKRKKKIHIEIDISFSSEFISGHIQFSYYLSIAS